MNNVENQSEFEQDTSPVPSAENVASAKRNERDWLRRRDLCSDWLDQRARFCVDLHEVSCNPALSHEQQNGFVCLWLYVNWMPGQ